MGSEGDSVITACICKTVIYKLVEAPRALSNIQDLAHQRLPAMLWLLRINGSHRRSKCVIERRSLCGGGLEPLLESFGGALEPLLESCASLAAPRCSHQRLLLVSALTSSALSFILGMSCAGVSLSRLA